MNLHLINKLFITQIGGSNKIFGATKRAVGNFIVAGLDVASVMEVMPGFTASGVRNVVGPHVMGTIGNFTVIKLQIYLSKKNSCSERFF